MVRVKICGITRIEDALAACEAGASALGFVFYEPSPRYIDPLRVREIVRFLPPFVTPVGVFVNKEAGAINRIVSQSGVTLVQLHGEEPAELVDKLTVPALKALRVRGEEDLAALTQYRVQAYLLDSHVPGKYGGTGVSFRWDVAVKAKSLGRIILSGGISADNVAEALRCVEPSGIDVSTGVETAPGIKDAEKMKALFRAVRSFGAVSI